MIYPRRSAILPTFVLAIICIASGCKGTSNVSSEADEASALGRSGSVEPAIRREALPQAIQQIEPSAGGVYLPTVLAGNLAENASATLVPTAEITPTASHEAIALQDAANQGATPIASAAPAAISATLPTALPTVRPTTTIAPTPVIEEIAIPSHRLASTTNILVLGSDRRRGTSNWRTDVIMLIALDLEASVAGVISFPRDIFIEDIPGSSGNRINTVDYQGERNGPGEGPKLLQKILSRNLGIPIDHYVRFEFDSFKDVVDALGGLSMTVDCPLFDEIPEEDLFIDLAPGTHQLNGEQALAFVRTRKDGGDLERVRRQQRVVWALRQQFLEENWLPQIPALYSSLSDAIQTDLGPLEIARLARFGLNISEDNVHGVVISPPDMLEQDFRAGMFVFNADWPLISQVTETVFERPPFVDTNTVGPGGDQPYCP